MDDVYNTAYERILFALSLSLSFICACVCVCLQTRQIEVMFIQLLHRSTYGKEKLRLHFVAAIVIDSVTFPFAMR